MSDQPLPYGRQWVDENDIQAVVDVLRGDFLTTGPAVEAFESALCQATGAAHAVAVNSGTAALHAAYFAAGVREGDEVITTPLTFAATANAARYLGANVKFVDIDPRTGNIEPNLIAAAITDKTRLIVPVDFSGWPADYDSINAVAAEHGLKVVADAAHSLGGNRKGKMVGTLADLTEVSTHPVKPVTTGEGGAVLTNDPELAETCRRFRSHGIERRPPQMKSQGGPWYHEQHDLGFNYRITDIQAALGASQMNRLPEFIARRRAIAARYFEGLAGIEGITLPPTESLHESGWHLFIVRIKGGEANRSKLFQALRARQLMVQVHYIPVYWHPYYQELGYQRGLCPHAEEFYESCVSLPIFPKLSDDDVESCIRRVREAIAEVLG